MSNVSIKFLVILYHSYRYTFCFLFRFYDTTHRGLQIMLMLILFPGNAFQRHFNVMLTPVGGACRMEMESRVEASRMEVVMTLINGFRVID